MSQQEENPSRSTRTLVVKPALSQMYDRVEVPRNGMQKRLHSYVGAPSRACTQIWEFFRLFSLLPAFSHSHSFLFSLQFMEIPQNNCTLHIHVDIPRHNVYARACPHTYTHTHTHTHTHSRTLPPRFFTLTLRNSLLLASVVQQRKII